MACDNCQGTQGWYCPVCAPTTPAKPAKPAAPSPEWIDVADRLPALDRIVPVRTQWGVEYAQRGQDDEDTWLWADQTGEAETCADWTISHWFDLPVAPEAP